MVGGHGGLSGPRQPLRASNTRSPTAAAQGDPLAPKIRDVVAAHMSPDQIAEAQRMAREWKPK
jgi:hypothetical protein